MGIFSMVKNLATARLATRLLRRNPGIATGLAVAWLGKKAYDKAKARKRARAGIEQRTSY